MAERFLGNQFNNFINSFKYPVIVLWMMWVGIALYFATQLTPITEQEEFLPEAHPIRVFQEDLEYYFGSTLYVLAIHIYWGVKGIDKSGVSMWDASDVGVAEFDPEFTIYSVEA